MSAGSGATGGIGEQMKQRAPTWVRTGCFQSMRPSVTPSLYRCGGVLTRRDPASLNGVTM